MTLHKFQKVIKGGFVLLVIAVYGAVAFSVGKVAANDTSTEVKEVKSGSNGKQIIQNPIPSTDFQSNEIMSSSVKLCSNTHYGFEISYDSNWFTTHNSEDQKCTFFAPYSFVVPEFIEGNFAPVNLEVIEPDNWLSTLQFYENPNDFYNINSSQNIEFNGRLIKKIKTTATGSGSTPRGYSAVHMLLFDGEKPIRLSYTQLEENDDINSIESKLLDMVGNIKYF